jgi:enoyl-CoA hydratase/carnithine racemase
MTTVDAPGTRVDECAAVQVENRGPIRIITLNRPEARNAIDLATAEGIERALDGYEADPRLRCAVITGKGSVFCAGMDLKAFLRGERPSTAQGGFAGLVERELSKPLVAAVNGPAVAGGFEIVLACDLIVASTESFFALPEVKRGLVAAGGGLLRLPLRIAYHVAMELALTGDSLTAQDAARLGLVNRLVGPDQVIDTAIGLATRIAANAPLATAASKRLVRQAPDWPAAEAWDHQRQLSEPVRASEDASEGARAFAEKRAPRWCGR